MRHVAFALFIALYVILIGQNWAVYTAAILVTLWVRNGGDLYHVPFTIGGKRA